MSPTLLVVEDEVIIGMDIKNSLQKLGYHVAAVVDTGEKAIDKAEKIRPDLILMDIILKGPIDGVEAASQIRQRFNLPIVFLTAHTDTLTLERAKETQPFGYIVKPFDEKDLHRTIEIALARFNAETEIRRALEKERELNELKSRFISMVSHEFRTPMSTILFSAGLLENYSNKWTEEKKLIHIHRIQSAIQHMTSLLNDVLLIGKSEAGKLEFQPKTIELKKVCYELVEELKISDNNQHQIIFNFHSNLTVAKLDEKLLQQIVSNLLSNAVKYSDNNTSIQFNVEYQDHKIILEVQDSGIGIPEEDQKRLFELFHRGTNVGTIQGTGLGLSIVKRSVDLHGGDIRVESELGVGTKFIVSLPIDSRDSYSIDA